jgi:hypothetical protein
VWMARASAGAIYQAAKVTFEIAGKLIKDKNLSTYIPVLKLAIIDFRGHFKSDNFTLVK